MKTELKDVFYLYLGQTCTIGDSLDVHPICMVTEQSVCTGTNMKCVPMWFKMSACKPILRHLSDITEMEFIKLLTIVYEKVFQNHPDIEKSSIHFDGDNSVGLKCVDRVDNSDIGFTIEIERGVEFSVNGSKLMVNQFDITAKLLERGFDLFGLIESGQAIDKATLKP